MNLLNSIIDRTEKNGGATYHGADGFLKGSKKYSVSIYPSRSTVVDELTTTELERFIGRNVDILSHDDNSLGTWKDESGKVWMDVVRTIDNRERAIELGIENNQIAIYGLENGELIETGGTGS